MFSRFALGLAFCLTSLVGCATGTAPDANNSLDESHDTAAISAERSAAAAKQQADIIAHSTPLSLAQATELLGDRLPSAAGEACTPGTQCAPDEVDIVQLCGGFTGVCGGHGTQVTRTIHFGCVTFTGTPTCQAFADQNTVTSACTVSTDGRACATGCNPDSCNQFQKTCDMTTDLVRSCSSGGTCSNEQCVNQTVTTTVVGACTRPFDTAGERCQQGEVPFQDQPCQAPKAPICNVNHACACLLGAQ